MIFRFKKEIRLLSTDLGWLNLPMIKFLQEHNPELIIHKVNRPDFGFCGQIEYYNIKTI